MSFDIILTSTKFRDPLRLYFVYIHYQGLRAQLKINAPSVLNDNRIKRKKREREKMACQRSITQKNGEIREKGACQRSMTQKNKKRVSQERNT